MSGLSNIDKMKLEKFLEMSGGYVLDFSNRTFLEFVAEHTNLNIYDEKYNLVSGSKANRLREFWKQESNYLVGKLLKGFIEYRDARKLSGSLQEMEDDSALREECLRIASKLKGNSSIEHIDAIKPISGDRDFSVLCESIKDMIQKDQPEIALDRLHTFVTKYIRGLCDRHGVTWERNKPLHSIFGEYIKKIKEKDAIQSVMTERILKSSISVFDAFSNVRNNQSLAHDNPVLNYDESILIFSNVTSTIKFIESIEKSMLES